MTKLPATAGRNAAGGQQAAARVIPAQQGLAADDPSARERSLRLVDEQEPAGIDRLADFAQQRQAPRVQRCRDAARDPQDLAARNRGAGVDQPHTAVLPAAPPH
jgi:hypothetical protein